MRSSTLGTEYQQLESRQTHPRLRLFMLSQCQRRSSHCNLSLASYVRFISNWFIIASFFSAHQEGSHIPLGPVLSTTPWWSEEVLVGCTCSSLPAFYYCSNASEVVRSGTNTPIWDYPNIANVSLTVQPLERNHGITESVALAVVIKRVKYFCQYLYEYVCHTFTSHDTLKALLNTSSFREACSLGSLLQGLDLTIYYVPGKTISKTDDKVRTIGKRNHTRLPLQWIICKTSSVSIIHPLQLTICWWLQ